MGAGCYYTSEIDGEKTYWVELETCSEESENVCFEVEDIFETIKPDFPKSWRFDEKSAEISNGLYLIKLESTYNSNGFVFNWHVNPSIANEPVEKLAKASYRNNWQKIGKILGKYFEVRIATSGYTSTRIFE